MKKLIVIISLLFSFANSEVNAHAFKWKSNVDSVAIDSFYNIQLSTDITRHLRNSFSDIRIYDERGNEIPYLPGKAKPVPYEKLYRSLEIVEEKIFYEYEIIEKVHYQNCCTKIILLNPGRKTIRNVSLVIKNSDVSKKLKLMGSDDRINCYALKDNGID